MPGTSQPNQSTTLGGVAAKRSAHGISGPGVAVTLGVAVGVAVGVGEGGGVGVAVAVGVGAAPGAGSGVGVAIGAGTRSGATATVSVPSVPVPGARLSFRPFFSRVAASRESATRPVNAARFCAGSSTAGRDGVTANNRTLAVPSRAETYEEVRPIVN